MKLYKFGLGNETIKSIKIDLPSGTKLVLRQNKYHVTPDKEDAEYASKLSGIQMMNPLQSEIIKHFESLPEVPTVDKELTKEEAMKYLWRDPDEEYVIQQLLERGYICEKVGAEPEAIAEAKIKLKFLNISDKVLMQEAARRGLVEQTTPTLDPVVEDYLSEEDKPAYLSKLHYTKVQIIARYLDLKWEGTTKEMVCKIIEVQNNGDKNEL